MHTLYHFPRLHAFPALLSVHTINWVVQGLVGIFVPVYLIKLGYPLPAVLFIFAGFALADIPYRVLGPKVLVRFGANKCMIFGLIGGALFLSLLAMVKSQPLLLIPAAILSGLQSFYWLAFHATCSDTIKTRRVGRMVGAISIATIAATAISPVLGGLIATMLGPQTLYVVAAILLVLAIVVLLDARTKVHPVDFDWKRIPLRKIRRDLVANGSNGMVTNGIEGVVWPLFVSILIPSYLGIGAVSSVIVLTSAVVTVYVAHREATVGELHYVRRGVSLYGLTNAFRTLVSTAIHVFGVNLFAGAGRSFLSVAYASRYYENSRKHSPVEYIAIMELWLSMCVCAFFLLLGLVALFLPFKLTLMIGLALAIPLSFGIARMR